VLLRERGGLVPLRVKDLILPCTLLPRYLFLSHSSRRKGLVYEFVAEAPTWWAVRNIEGRNLMNTRTRSCPTGMWSLSWSASQ